MIRLMNWITICVQDFFIIINTVLSDIWSLGKVCDVRVFLPYVIFFQIFSRNNKVCQHRTEFWPSMAGGLESQPQTEVERPATAGQ